MLGNAAAALTTPLKRHRDDEEDGKEGQSLPASKRRGGAPVLRAASSEVVDRSTANLRPAEGTAQQESFMIPGGWDLVGISGSPHTTPIYPPPSSVGDTSLRSGAPSVSKDDLNPSGSTIIKRGTLIESTLKAIDADVGQEKLGLPVTRFPCPSSNFVDEDYPDYGQPNVKVYATGTPPWIYAGVDFTDPFDPNEFIMPYTFRRKAELGHWLGLCREMAADAKQPFPAHLHKLFSVVEELKRRRGREWHHRITTAIEELEAKGTSADVPQVLDQTKLTWLPSALQTNDRTMCLFLYEAPLTKYAPIRYSDEVTLQILQASGWSPRTVLVRAQDIEKIPNWPRLQVFDAGAWLAHKQVLDDLLASAIQSYHA
ncbi:hypothetical protein CF319_g2086 [Tilletia indica]|nr:hypothetical protein CF319_g2086 [Tilletia indica]